MPPTDRRDDAPEGDVLSALPRTRPQRRSARRAAPPKPAAEVPAAGDAVVKPAVAAPAAKAKPRAAKPKASTKAKATGAAAKAGAPAKRRAAKGTASARPQPPAATAEVPPAGYATGSAQDGDGGGRPGTGDLVTTALQAVGEVAQLGAAVGQQAVRSALRRIPRP